MSENESQKDICLIKRQSQIEIVKSLKSDDDQGIAQESNPAPPLNCGLKKVKRFFNLYDENGQVSSDEEESIASSWDLNGRSRGESFGFGLEDRTTTFAAQLS